jgi:hypothetical protein
MVLIMGCSTTPVPYSFVEDENETASVDFINGNPGVVFIGYDTRRLPEPAKKTYWRPVLFPAGQALNIEVHVYFEQVDNSPINLAGLVASSITASLRDRRKVDRDLSFECPALDSGNSYQLYFTKGYGVPGDNTLILKNKETDVIIYEQRFENK